MTISYTELELVVFLQNMVIFMQVVKLFLGAVFICMILSEFYSVMSPFFPRIRRRIKNCIVALYIMFLIWAINSSKPKKF